MASKFIFIRHGQLIKPYSNHLKMDFNKLADLALGKADPILAGNAKRLFIKQTDVLDFSNVDTIYFNNSGKQSRRSYESAKIIASVLKKSLGKSLSLKGLPEIHEINFNLKPILSRTTFKHDGMPALRSALYHSILGGGRHSESKKSLSKRINKILSVVRLHSQRKTDALFVTHDFFMKFIEIYIISGHKFSTLSVAKLNRTKLNRYFGGFVTNDKMTKIITRFGK